MRHSASMSLKLLDMGVRYISPLFFKMLCENYERIVLWYWVRSPNHDMKK